jgi:Flp pilus assembly secretin CpaC
MRFAGWRPSGSGLGNQIPVSVISHHSSRASALTNTVLSMTKRLIMAVVAAAATLTPVSGALADGGAPPAPRARASATAPQQGLTVPLDMAAPVRLPSDAAGVIVGNPSIAGVSVQSNRLLFVTGRSYGTTSLTVVDANGATIYHGRITVVPDETGAVMVTRGTETQRLTCNPVCRPQPDIGDGEEAFSTASGQITARNGMAGGE